MEVVLRVLKRDRDVEWPFSKRAIKKRKNEEILEELRAKYPGLTFRLNSVGTPQRKYGKQWCGVCIHNKQKHKCPDPECGGGSSLCEHKREKGQCKKCGGIGYCIHGRRKQYCHEPGCDGTGFCALHGIRKDICPDPQCGGGGSLCEHGGPRYLCKVEGCEGGGGGRCVHGKIRHYCNIPECNGGGSICIKCKLQKKHIGDYCITCHPDYIPVSPHGSKIGCKYICDMQKHLNIKIQHSHYDLLTKQIVGKEYTIPEWTRKKVDGFYVGPNQEKIVIEFLGDYYHGHPSYWLHDEEATNRFGIRHRDKFYDTETKLQKLASFGYVVRYVWECEYRRLKALQSPLSILREFDGTLRY